jgi:hypothetical protein
MQTVCNKEKKERVRNSLTILFSIVGGDLTRTDDPLHPIQI